MQHMSAAENSDHPLPSVVAGESMTLPVSREWKTLRGSELCCSETKGRICRGKTGSGLLFY